MRKKAVRVLHVTRVPITVTAFLMPLLREHRLRGEAVSVACTDGLEVAQIEEEGFEVHHFRLNRSLAVWNLTVALWDLSRIVRREHIDWVFTHTPIASAVARLASRIGGARGTIYMAHGLPCGPHMARSTWLLWYVVERLLGWFTDGLITTNRYDYRLAWTRRFIRRRGNIFQVNGIGVHTGRFDRLRLETNARTVKEELGLAPDEPMVLLLARTLPDKGIREFLEAAHRLVKDRVSCSFAIGGEGPLDGEIGEFINRYNLHDRVVHLGWRRDAHRLITACDLYVLPTYYPEGLPVSILEAMACGKPVVATRHRGCEDEVVDGVTGLLVEPQDPGALANAMRTFIEDPDKARSFGQAGRQRIDENFRIDQTTNMIIAAFDKITTCHAALDNGSIAS